MLLSCTLRLKESKLCLYFFDLPYTQQSGSGNDFVVCNFMGKNMFLGMELDMDQRSNK